MSSCDMFLYEILILFFSANFHCLFWKEDSLKWHFLHRDENKIISKSLLPELTIHPCFRVCKYVGYIVTSDLT